MFNPLSANPEKWSNTLKQIVGSLPTICLSVFDHFMNLAFKGLRFYIHVKPAVCNFIKKEARVHEFSSEFIEIFENTYFVEHLQTTASVIRLDSYETNLHSGLVFPSLSSAGKWMFII